MNKHNWHLFADDDEIHRRTKEGTLSRGLAWCSKCGAMRNEFEGELVFRLPSLRDISSNTEPSCIPGAR